MIVFNPLDFKGVFLFGSDKLDKLHKENAWKPANQRMRKNGGKIETYYVNDVQYSYVVDHGQFLTFNTWQCGKIVPEIVDLSDNEYLQLMEKGLIQ